MWAASARRGGARALRVFAAGAWPGAGDAAAGQPLVAAAAVELQWGGRLGLGRPFTGTSMWEVGTGTQARHQDLYLARQLLPHRSAFSPQFTPHGVYLMPQRLPSRLADFVLPPEDDEDADAGAGAAADAAAAGVAAAAAACGGDVAGGGLLCDSVKRKRKLKMKKHKYKKRMKQLRHQLK